MKQMSEMTAEELVGAVMDGMYYPVKSDVEGDSWFDGHNAALTELLRRLAPLDVQAVARERFKQEVINILRVFVYHDKEINGKPVSDEWIVNRSLCDSLLTAFDHAPGTQPQEGVMPTEVPTLRSNRMSESGSANLEKEGGEATEPERSVSTVHREGPSATLAVGGTLPAASAAQIKGEEWKRRAEAADSSLADARNAIKLIIGRHRGVISTSVTDAEVDSWIEEGKRLAQPICAPESAMQACTQREACLKANRCLRSLLSCPNHKTQADADKCREDHILEAMGHECPCDEDGTRMECPIHGIGKNVFHNHNRPSAEHLSARCPKCGASMLAMRDRLTGVSVACNGKETHFFEMKRLDDFAQFFATPALEKQETAACTKIYEHVPADAFTIECSNCKMHILMGTIPACCPACGIRFDQWREDIRPLPASIAQKQEWERIDGIDIRWEEEAKVFIGRYIVYSQGETKEAAVDAIKNALAMLGSVAEQKREMPGWFLVDIAPKDGKHILAADFSGNAVGFGGNPQQSFQCVVHWWQWCDGTHPEESGWYPSTGAGESGPLTNLTHWKPLEELESLSSAPEITPACHICGAVMNRYSIRGRSDRFGCATCGATTGCTDGPLPAASESEPSSEIVVNMDLAQVIARKLNEHGFIVSQKTDGDSIDPITVIRNTLGESKELQK